MPITRINTIYDLVNAQHRRGLFYRTVATAGEFELPETLTADGMTLLRLHGDLDEDRQLLEHAETFVASGEMSKLAFSVGEELGVQSWVHLADIPAGPRHSAVLLNVTGDPDDAISPLISGLIRQGFPHVLVNRTGDRKSTRLNSSHTDISRMPSSA